MKKLLVFLFSFLLLVSAPFISFASVDSIYEVAIVSIKGDVQVDTNGDGIWIKPWIGMKLMESAVIKTGDNSTMDIVFDAEGLNVVRVKANTLTTIKNALMELSGGEVLARFANLKPGSSFTVKTPTAACAIRGSVMGVGFNNGITTGMAFQGNLYIQPLDSNGNPIGGENTLPEGNKTDVDGDGNMGDPEGLDDQDNEEFNNFQNDTGGGSGSGDTGGELDDTDPELDTKDVNDILNVEDSDDSTQISPTDEISDYSVSVGPF